tara:strand:+ start:344 stop:520 length:177 start_codon:yes stop_codon:yes gene_type:complete
MNTGDSIDILKKRLDNPFTSDKHKMEIMDLFKKAIVWDKNQDIMDWFEQMRELVKNEE